MSKTTTVGEAQVTQSPHDVVTVELIQPADMPAIVRVDWPPQPTLVNPQTFRDTAAAMVKLFSEAYVTLTHIRAGKYL
jgi:hypothetical protein